MVRLAKKGRKGKKDNDSSSDDDLYDNGDDAFDKKNPFGDDEIESFHANRDKQIFDRVKTKNKSKNFTYSSDEEEVLAFDDDDDDDNDDEDEEDVNEDEEDEEDEDDDEEKDEIDEENEYGIDLGGTWGSRKSAYYNGNKIENDEDAQLEEEEAKLLQEKMMKRLDASDFGLDAFMLEDSNKVKPFKTSDEISASKLKANIFGDDEEESKSLAKITKNLTEMSKRERIEYLERESPELFELAKEFKAKLSELNETLLPIFNLIKSDQIPQSMASDYIIIKTKLNLIYCCHLSFYFILKSQRMAVNNHPIIKNILQFRNICKVISPIDEQLKPEIKFILESLKSNKPLSFIKPRARSDENKKLSGKLKKALSVKKSALSNDKSERLQFDDDEDDENDEQMRDIDEDEKKLEVEGEEDEDEDEDGEDSVEKRAINYQIEKNKGLTPKRNKMYRNPRVRNRFKARKAIIKRKSIVPTVRTEAKRYSGEASGIRTAVVRGVKIK